MIAAPRPREQGNATSADGTRIAWSRFGDGDRVILFVPTWNLVDSRVVGNQVAALEPHATVLTYDPRGAGASERPEQGYDFPHHTADAVAVLAAAGVERASIVTASRGVNAALLLADEHPGRVDRIAAVAPYMRLEPDPTPPSPHWLESLVADWRGFIVPFMHSVFSEPGSEDVIAEMIGIGLEAAPAVIVAQERELDWRRPARLLGAVGCPTLVVHGDEDAPVPLSHAETHRGCDDERTARGDRRRRPPSRHPHAGTRQPAPARLPPRVAGRARSSRPGEVSYRRPLRAWAASDRGGTHGAVGQAEHPRHLGR